MPSHSISSAWRPLRSTFPLIAALACVTLAEPASAELKLNSLFTDHMVLQRNVPVHIWGWAEPNATVTVSIDDASVSTQSGTDGRFDASLPAMKAGGPYELTIRSGSESKTIRDVLFGEVWICSGQSNMAWTVANSNDADLEIQAANFPKIRLISVPRVGTQQPQTDFEGSWSICDPDTVKGFSAVGYFFGRQLNQTLDVPIGLINNAWGGSAAEAWVERDVLTNDGKYEQLLKHWDDLADSYDFEALKSKYDNALKKYLEGGRQGRRPSAPRNQLTGNHRPANIYNGVLKPTIGYSIKGVIWYQGESNAERAYQYRDLFPLMIQSWRDEWGQGDFPFYWVQLADYKPESEVPSESSWAELREAQTMTMDRLPNSGEAVILNLGEATDIHPRNKQVVGMRLARWALNRDYGIDVACQSPRFDSISFAGGEAIVKFRHVGGGLDTFDVKEMLGFTIAGKDKKFVDATAVLLPGSRDTVVVYSDEVDAPTAVRYAWADNPVCNVQSTEGLPLTPFRSDDFPGVTADRAAP